MTKGSDPQREMRERLSALGLDARLVRLVTETLHTDYTARQMAGYLRQARPRSAEEVVDEMLAILERRDMYVQKKIAQSAQKKMNSIPDFLPDRFIRSAEIIWENGGGYAEGIEALARLDVLEMPSNITFFAGENGTGKSTLLEGIAAAWGANPEGGTQNYRFSTFGEEAVLGRSIRLVRSAVRPAWCLFLRAESFYNVAAATEQYQEGGMTELPHYLEQSHGESFLTFITRFDGPGLCFMDEPESALSVRSQMTLLLHLVRRAREGCQFIIATHSPILLGTPGAAIYSFDDGEVRRVTVEETASWQMMKLFLDDRERFLAELLREDEDGDGQDA